MSDIIRDHRRRAYQNMIYQPFYERGANERVPIQPIPNADRSAPYSGEKPKVEGVPPVPGQNVKRYKPGEIA